MKITVLPNTRVELAYRLNDARLAVVYKDATTDLDLLRSATNAEHVMILPSILVSKTGKLTIEATLLGSGSVVEVGINIIPYGSLHFVDFPGSSTQSVIRREIDIIVEA